MHKRKTKHFIATLLAQPFMFLQTFLKSMIFYTYISGDVVTARLYDKALPTRLSYLFRINLKKSVILLCFKLSRPLQSLFCGGPKRKLAFIGVFTVKEYNGMLSNKISVHKEILMIFYLLNLSGQAKLSMASLASKIWPPYRYDGF